MAPYNEAELERLRSKGILDTEDHPMVLVERPGGPGPRHLFQLVPESKVVKNRLHLDLLADDPAAELRRLVGLGARVLDERATWVVLADPEGNELDLWRNHRHLGKVPGFVRLGVPQLHMAKIRDILSTPVPRSRNWLGHLAMNELNDPNCSNGAALPSRLYMS